MSNQYIPKERLTAYERWEMAAFDEAEQLAKAMRETEARAPLTPPEEVIAPPPPPPAISAEELAELRQQASDQGRAEGFETGMKEGHAEGYASGEAHAQSQSAALAALAKSFSEAIESTESQLAEAMLTLALDIAAQVLRTSIKIKPDLILPVVREAMAALTNQHGRPSLQLHPEDAALVRQYLGDQLSHSAWRIMEDSQLPRGDCRVENSGAEIDATLATRWRRVIDNLGRKSEWLDMP